MFLITRSQNSYFDAESGEKISLENIAKMSEQGMSLRVLERSSGEDVTEQTLEAAFNPAPSPLVQHMVKDYSRRLMGATSGPKILEIFREIAREIENRRPADSRHLRDFALKVVSSCNLGESAKASLYSVLGE